ncbi:chordin-like protein 1 isoform X2 [Dendronephthya gigantea]|uniref:chordin-like protein 1 isoform X2 n=1 Tax=Dendronephthya gigantea TaxID=151771 RepID=UPI001069B5FA|nr:chordin-like protein 1 isoform X2 [Dendronephthya gigantea]
MALKSRLFLSISLILVAMMIWECMGLISPRGLNTKQRRRSRTCKFGNKNFMIGQKWNPHLAPNGINYCIVCRCKKGGLIDCSRVQCAGVSCPGKFVPNGKCCAVCPSPNSGTLPRRRHCRNSDGKRYQQGEVWKIPIEKDLGDNNCGECTCHNGRVSCAVRICPTLKCPTLMHVEGKDSCCKQCRGFPLVPVGGLSQFKAAVTVQGSCFDKGRYYKNKDMWNPLGSTSDTKVFQKPNCDLCVCQNTTVNCKTVLCPKLDCDNSFQNANECCRSCPDINRTSNPFLNRTLPQNTTPKRPTDCIFLSKTYSHNSSWTPQIPGHEPNSCARCTCQFSRITCNRNGCVDNTTRRRNVKSLTKPNVNRRLCSSGERVEVRLFVNSKRLKAKQNFIARIAVINPKEAFVNVHFWDVSDTKATIKSSKPRKARFEGRKTNYAKLGETKLGRITRFLRKERTLANCTRGCKRKAKDFINNLKTRVGFLKSSSLCTAFDLFTSLKPRRP